MLRRAIRRARGHFQASVANNTENDNEQFHSTVVPLENYPQEKYGIRVLSDKDEKRRNEMKLNKYIGMSAIVATFLTNKDESTQAWRHLASIYEMFELLQNNSLEQEERITGTSSYPKQNDEGLRSLVRNLQSPSREDFTQSQSAANVIYRDLEALVQSVPEGHDREAFLELGNALYNEMIHRSVSPSPVFEPMNGISRDSYAKVGQAMYSSEVTCA